MKPLIIERILPCALSDDDRIKLGDHMATLVEELDKLEEEKKNIPDKIKARRKELTVVKDTLNRGLTDKAVQCEWIIDHQQGMRFLHRKDTGELIDQRILTDEERQIHIDEQIERMEALFRKEAESEGHLQTTTEDTHSDTATEEQTDETETNTGGSGEDQTAEDRQTETSTDGDTQDQAA